MHVILATSSLINLYLDDLVERFKGDYIIIEYSNIKVVQNRSLKIFDFTYNSVYGQISKTRKLKILIDNLNTKQSYFYITHALNIVGNYISFKKNAKVSIIPDGMLNYMKLKAYSGTYRNLFNTKIFCILCGFVYKKPLTDVYNSGNKKYLHHYYLLRKNLRPAHCQHLIELKLHIKEKVNVEKKGTIILGQYCESDVQYEYSQHIISIVKLEKTYSDSIVYKSHPFEIMTADFKNLLYINDIRIVDDKKPFELSQINFKRIVGVTSTALFTAKISGVSSTVVAYHKNLWKYEHDEYNSLLNVFKDSGVILYKL